MWVIEVEGRKYPVRWATPFPRMDAKTLLMIKLISGIATVIFYILYPFFWIWWKLRGEGE